MSDNNEPQEQQNSENNSQAENNQEVNQEESEAESVQNEADESSVFKIFITTDNHLGYKEHDPIRGNDSFDAFDEALQM